MIPHENSTVPDLAKKFSVLHGTRRIISGSTEAHCQMLILRSIKVGHDLKPCFRAVQFAAQGSHEFRQLVSIRPARIEFHSQERVPPASSSLKTEANHFKSGKVITLSFYLSTCFTLHLMNILERNQCYSKVICNIHAIYQPFSCCFLGSTDFSNLNLNNV
jgi:hypothetical protein